MGGLDGQENRGTGREKSKTKELGAKKGATRTMNEEKKKKNMRKIDSPITFSSTINENKTKIRTVLLLDPKKGPFGQDRLRAVGVKGGIEQRNVRQTLQRAVRVALLHHGFESTSGKRSVFCFTLQKIFKNCIRNIYTFQASYYQQKLLLEQHQGEPVFGGVPYVLTLSAWLFV
jgi:hypothetical protein